MTNLIKQAVLTILSFACLCFSLSAHADFRKALDAYIARDGETMLKEVKHAVDTKNDDGLMLFLMATNMDAATSDYDAHAKHSKSTLRAILPGLKWDEMRGLLVEATENSTLDSQYYLLANTQFKRRYQQRKQITDEYVKKGSRLAKLNSKDIAIRAEAGDPEAQLKLGMEYINSQNTNRDEGKGYYWLLQATKSYEVNPHADIGAFSEEMCRLFERKHQKDSRSNINLRQAFLWCAKAYNEKSYQTLGPMRVSGVLKKVAPSLDAAWGTDQFDFEMSKIPQPELVLVARNELATESVPIFTYYLSSHRKNVVQNYYQLNVYENGMVNINLADGLYHEVNLTTVTGETMEAFSADLQKIGFKDWPVPPSQYPTTMCVKGNNCPKLEMHVADRSSAQTNRRFLFAWEMEVLDKEGIAKFNITEDQVKRAKVLQEKYNKFISRVRIAKVHTLVEKYFPTQKLRCNLSSSNQFKQACMHIETNLENLAKEGK